MSGSLAIGDAIYISIKPMIKIFLNGAVGFYLARTNVFTVEFCQKMSIAIVNVLSPCLVFSRIVSTISVDEIRTIGVIVLIGFVYQAIGLLAGMILNKTTPVPKNWHGGMKIAGMLNNAGDLPVAYVTTLAQGTLFTASDGAKGTSYAIAFMFCFTMCLFNFGGYRLIENDFKDRLSVPDDEESQTEGGGSLNEKNLDNGTVNDGHDHSVIDLENVIRVASTQMESAIASDSDDNEEISPIYGATHSGSSRHRSSTARKSTLDETPSKPIFFPSSAPVSENPTPPNDYNRRLSTVSRTQVGAPARSNRQISVTGNPDELPSIRNFSDSPLVMGGGEDLDSMDRVRPSETIDDVVENYSQFETIRKINSIQHQQQRGEFLRNRLQPQTSDIQSFSGQISLNQEACAESTVVDRVVQSSKTREGKGLKVRILNYYQSIVDNSKSKKEIYAMLKRNLWQLGINFLRPASLALIVAVIIAVITPVRRLFYNDGTPSSIPNAPDGLAVLSFVMDITNFIGNAAVPCGMCMLGATLSRLKVASLPKGFWKSVLLMSLFKLVILPIIGILIVTRLMVIGWIDKSNYMAIFVIIVSAGTPGSTSQIYITALYTPPGDNHEELDWVSTMLIVQYCCLIITLTIVVTYTLKNIVGF